MLKKLKKENIDMMLLKWVTDSRLQEIAMDLVGLLVVLAEPKVGRPT